MSAWGDGDPGSHAPASFDEVATELVRGIAPVIVSELDADGRTTAIRGALLDRLGYPEEWFVGKLITDISDDATAQDVVDRVLRGEEVRATVTLNRRPWLVWMRPVHGADGTVEGAVSVMTYVEDSRAQQELVAQEHLNRQFEAVIELSQDFIAIVDLDRRVTYLNRAGREMVGLTDDDDEVIGMSSDDLLSPDAVQRTRDEEARFLTTGRWEGISSLRNVKTGEVIPVSAQTFLVSRSLDGRPLALASVRRDLRAEQATKRAISLRIQEQRALAELGRQAVSLPLAELLQEGVELVAARYRSMTAGVMQRTDEGDSRMVACSRPEWLDVRVATEPDSLTGRALLENVPVHTSDVVSDDRFPHENPTERFAVRSALCYPIPGTDGPWGVVGVSAFEPHRWTDDDLAFLESVTAVLGAAVRRDDLEAQLQHQALHDPLTGLPNRALVMDRVDTALGRSARRGSMLAVLMLDVDDFKSVNDALGHRVGDRLLAELALRLASVVRDGDTVARLGGDEFVVLCEEVAGEDDVAFVAEALLEAGSAGLTVDGRPLSVTLSVGVALAVSGEPGTTSLLAEADIAMYRAKRDRPGTYRIFDEEMRGDVLGRINVAGELRAAVREERIGLAFQPIVDLRTGEVVALEALARWTNEDGRAVPPDLFIPVAEETGLIGELGRLVLRDAARAATTWQDRGPIGVRVNASAHELRSRSYVDQVSATLESTGLAPGLLGIEITESVLVDETKVTQDNLARLREAGVTLLIDDFGTGYSSLSYLQRFPVVDVLKVDRSFLGAGTRGEAVVQAVVGLGRAFGLQVCAEGVETDEQHARVAELGCEFAQGFLLGRPVPGPEVRDLLAGWRPVVPARPER